MWTWRQASFHCCQKTTVRSTAVHSSLTTHCNKPTVAGVPPPHRVASGKMDRKKKEKQMSSPESVTMARQCSLMSSSRKKPPIVAPLEGFSSEDLSPPTTPRSPEVQHLWAHGNEPFRPTKNRPCVSRGPPLLRKRLVLAKLTSHRSWPISPSR